MLTNSPLYAGFAVDDIAKAKEFYGGKLDVRVVQIDTGLLSLQASNGYAVLIYVKESHEPAAHTILNFPVDDIEARGNARLDRDGPHLRADHADRDERHSELGCRSRIWALQHVAADRRRRRTGSPLHARSEHG
ncbi:hypothetical protein BH20ACT13_BH20ACT13_09650 [soil metagenome]